MNNSKSSIISIQGEREHMEDRYFYSSDIDGKGSIYAGVYDGHGGSKAAEFVAQNLHKHFLEYLATFTPLEAFTQAYGAISDQITPDMAGTCAADFFICDNTMYYANAGDCRIIVVGDGVKQLTIDHRLSEESEKERIIKAGGTIRGPYVFTGFRGLMVTRSLGDHYHKSVGVIAEPSVGQYTIQPLDRYIIAASDGLFGFVGNEAVAETLKNKKDMAEITDSLKEAALKNRSSDNITIVVINLNY